MANFCVKCGAPLSGRFCVKCGADMSNVGPPLPTTIVVSNGPNAASSSGSGIHRTGAREARNERAGQTRHCGSWQSSSSAARSPSAEFITLRTVSVKSFIKFRTESSDRVRI